MRAAVLRGVHDLNLEELPDPTPSQSGVVVRVTACGVCATDVNMWRGANTEGKFPFIPGHEWVGEIVDVGRDVANLAVGDRVVGEVAVGCGACRNCKDGLPPEACLRIELYGFSWETPGALAEYHASPAGRLHKVPDGLTDEEATLVEPLSIGYNAVWTSAGGITPHERAAVIGCGPIGLLAMLVCKAAGAFALAIEPHPYRRKMALDLGADAVVDPTEDNFLDQVKEHTAGRGPSLVIECSGNERARESAIDIVSYKGRVVLVGIRANSKVPIELDKVIFKNAKVIGSDGSGFLFSKPLDLMSRGLVEFQKVITHRYSLEKLGDALELGAAQGESSKITVYPWDN
jgi:2-desacetyl-2-hydroxyethyl bacteriochlorophyllide A dehydrogenase